METEEFDQRVINGIVMAERVTPAVNTQPLTGPEDIANPAPAEEIDHQEILHIPRKPVEVHGSAGPSGLNANNDMSVDELLNSHHPREMLPLFQQNVPRGVPRFVRRDHKPDFFVAD